jgi:hypothetical protein
MINQVDEMLRHLLASRLNDPPPQWQIDVEVRPPNDEWRAYVNSLARPALNIYMVEVREDRDQRTTAANTHTAPEPFRVDCHYLLSAWIPTSDPNFATPTVVEDWLLSETLLILADEAPINATRIYNGSLPTSIEPILIDNDLRTEVAPAEGYSNLADFWTGVGLGNVWRAAAHLIITVPLLRTSQPVGPLVTNLTTTYRPDADPYASGPFDPFVHIGGRVLNSADAPVIDAWVQLEPALDSPPLRATRTDQVGRFRMYDLADGDYWLRASAAAYPETVVPITVPSPSGGYELVLN